MTELTTPHVTKLRETLQPARTEHMLRRLQAAIDLHNRRQQDPNRIDSYPRATLGGGTSGGDTANPTANTALLAIETTAHQPPSLTPYLEQLHESMTQLTTGIIDTLDTLAAIDALNTQARAALPRCSQPFCHDPAEPGRRGMCDPCRRWCDRHTTDHPGDPRPTVPQAVIDARETERTRRRTPAPDHIDA